MGRIQSCRKESKKTNECIRCKGFVVFDKSKNFCKQVAELRCVNCGWTKTLDADYGRVKVYTGKSC